MDDFKQKHSTDDQVFPKNINLSNTVANIIFSITLLNAPEIGIVGQRS